MSKLNQKNKTNKFWCYCCKTYSWFKHKPTGWLILSGTAFLIVLSILLSIAELSHFDFFNDRKSEITNLHAASLIILTILLICVGWYQLMHLNKSTKADFLLRIDDRYGSKSNVEARKIIHEFYCEAMSEIKNKEELSTKTVLNIATDKIAKKILEIELDKKKATNFIHVLNLLDFLETIAYFCNNEYISPKDINELVGGSIIKYYEVFKPFIKKRREEYDDNDYYCEVEKLAENLKLYNK